MHALALLLTYQVLCCFNAYHKATPSAKYVCMYIVPSVTYFMAAVLLCSFRI